MKNYILKFNENYFGDNDYFSKNCLSKQSIDKPINVFDTKRNIIGECLIDSDEIGVFIKEIKLNNDKNIDISNLGFGFKNMDDKCLPRYIVGFDAPRYIKSIEIMEIIKNY